MTERLAAFLAQSRKLFARERLPPPAEEAPRRERRPGLAKLLFTIEPLPQDEAPAPRPRQSLLRVVFAPERLPLDPPSPPRTRTRWLSWLFGREDLDRELHRREVP